MSVEYFQENDTSIDDRPDEPISLSELTGFQRDLLFVVSCLNGTHPNGVAIKHELRDVYGEEINHTRLYQNLRELFKEGFIEKRPLDGRTNAYRVSSSACEHLEAHASWMKQCLRDNDAESRESI